ncbi:MAG: hypothetical protein ACTHJT_03725 [Cytophaga sp.]|uniref:hypothetical protein n=1 Tax=Cytophaga sp. TaxID=29535 RepID=UPI003F807994
MKNEYENLKEAIALLKKKKRIERNLLNEYIHDVQESLKPINLIKGLFNQSHNESLIDMLIGMGTGYLSKKVFVGGSHNIFKKGFGVLVQMGVEKFTSGHTDSIKDFGTKIFKTIFNKKPKEEIETSPGIA